MLRNTLLVLLATTSILSAQVGVNEPNPSQTLDVNGKVEISDDNRAPTDGTLRYNDGAADFEGYTGGEWRSLTKSATPDDPQPVVFAHFGVENNATWGPFDRSYDYTRSDPTQDLFSVTVPLNKILVVDQICATLSTGSNPDDYFYASVRPSRLSGGEQIIANPQIVLGGSRRDGTTCIEAERAPLIVVKNQGSVRVWNSTNSGGEVRLLVFGFYVDDLDQYFSY